MMIDCPSSLTPSGLIMLCFSENDPIDPSFKLFCPEVAPFPSKMIATHAPFKGKPLCKRSYGKSNNV